MCSAHAKSKEKKTKGKVWKAAKIEIRGKGQELPRRKNTRYNKIKPPYVYLSYDVIHLILIPFSERQVFGHAYAKTIHHATFFFGQRISGLYLVIRVRWSSWICKVGSETAVAEESGRGREA